MADLPEITPDHWIAIPNWSKFQHYKDRDPVWIKVYVDLLHNPDFLGLSPACRGLLMTIWLLYASENGPVPVRFLTRYGRKLSGYYQLVALNHAGFIHFAASKTLALEVEKEVEKETPSPLSGRDALRELRSRAVDLMSDMQGHSTLELAEALENLERDLHAKLPGSERDRLLDEWGRRMKGTP